MSSNQQESYIEDTTIKDMFFKSSGRLNRLRFLKRTVLLAFIATILLTIIGVIFSDSNLELTSTGQIITDVFLVLFLVPSYFLNVRRLQDLNKGNQLAIVEAVTGLIGSVLDVNKFFMVIAVATVIACAISLYLLFADGTHGRNNYGPDPLGRA